MPGESANSEPIIPSEDAPTEGFNMGKYLVRRSMSEAWHLKTDLNITVKIKNHYPKIPLSAFVSDYTNHICTFAHQPYQELLQSFRAPPSFLEVYNHLIRFAFPHQWRSSSVPEPPWLVGGELHMGNRRHQASFKRWKLRWAISLKSVSCDQNSNHVIHSSRVFKIHQLSPKYQFCNPFIQSFKITSAVTIRINPFIQSFWQPAQKHYPS